MQWLLDNWIWLLLGVGMIAMHLFGHGGHGGGRHEGANANEGAGPAPRNGAGDTVTGMEKDRDR